MELNDRMRDDDQYRFVFEENLMYLTKEYYVKIIIFTFYRVCIKITIFKS